MKTWIIVAAIVAVVFALGLLYLTIGETEEIQEIQEGFLTVDPGTIGTQRRLLQAEGERRYNDLARLQNPNSNLSADLVDAAVNNVVPTGTSNTDSLLSLLGFTNLGGADDGSNKQGAGVEQTGMVQSKINFCEGITTVNCDLLGDPRLAECGFCHRDGVNSKGKAQRGGMYISSDDQIRANEKAGSGGKAVYQPTIGTCKPRNFTLMKDNCVAKENDIQCQTAGAATSANTCGQCFGSAPPGTTGLLYMGPKPVTYSATLWVSHPGLHSNGGAGTRIVLNGKTYTIPTSNKTLLDPQSLTVQMKEGDTMSITVYGMPLVWCAWFQNQAGTRTFGINLGETSMTPQNGIVIAGDARSTFVQKKMSASADPAAWASFKATVPSNVLWYQRREIVPDAIISAYYASSADGSQGSTDVTSFVKSNTAPGQDYPTKGPSGYSFLYVKRDDGSTNIFPNDGSIVKTAQFANQVVIQVTVPASLVEPRYSDDKENCPTGPIVLTEIGAGLMGANSCFAADGSFDPSLSCIQTLFASAGSDQGTMYPKTKEAALALAQKDPATGKPTLDATVTYLNNLANIGLYGVDMNGGPVSFANQKVAALQMLGVSLNNPCDGPTAQTGPHSAECLDYLWRTSGNASLDGSQIDPTTIPYAYCAPVGQAAPLNKDGSINQANVTAANQLGAIPNVRAFYQTVFNKAQDSTDFNIQSVGMRECYNVNLVAPPATPSACPPPNPTEWQCFQNSSGFSMSSGGLIQVSIDDNNKVVGVNTADGIWTRTIGSTLPNWTQLPGALVQVDTKGGNIVGVNRNQLIYRWTNGNWAQIPGQATWASVGADGDFWCVNQGQRIFHWVSGAWTVMPGNMVQVAVGNAANVYAVSAAGSVFKWSGANWSAVQTPNTNIKQVAVTGDGSKLAAIDKSGGIYVRTGTTWATLSGALTASVGISNNYIVGTNTDQRIYYKQLTSDAGRYACKEVNNQVTCVSTNGNDPVMFETEAKCKAFISDPGTAKWSITAAPSGPLASLVDNFVRARV
jgi:virginiamycin B lyase